LPKTRRTRGLSLVPEQHDIIRVESSVHMSYDKASKLNVLPPQPIELEPCAPVVCENAYDGLAVSFANRTIVAAPILRLVQCGPSPK
jgi:hypothetical protein